MDARRGADRSVQSLINFGLKQKEIAFRVHVDEATISKIHTNPDWSVSEALADALTELVHTVRTELFFEVTAAPKVVVLETCNHAGTAVDDSMRVNLATVIISNLKAAFQSDEAPAKFPDGIDAVLARIEARPDEVYVILLRPSTDRDARLLLAHELMHIVDRLKSGLNPIDTYRPQSEY